MLLNTIADRYHYHARGLSLAMGFFTRRLLHCNLQLTYRCNFQCAICDFWKTHHEARDEMSLADVRRIGASLAQVGSFIISLAGGEPLMREDLDQIILSLNQAGHFPILITNGWYVDDARARSIQRAGLQEISVSVDYADPARHDAQRGRPGSWQRAIRALELLHQHRPDRLHRVHMISVLMDDNLDQIEPLIQICRQMGITYLVNLYSWNRGTKQPRLPGQRVAGHLLDLKAKYPQFVSLTSYIEHLDQAIDEGGVGDCQTGRMLLNIKPDGDVTRCTETLDEPLGNILRQPMDDIRRSLLDVQRRQPCSKCWTSCRGFVESMQMKPRLRQLKEFYVSIKPH